MVGSGLRDREAATREEVGIPRAIWIWALCLGLAVAAITLVRHWYFLSTSYDMAFYAHAISQISVGEWTNTMFGFHVFADHFSPILILLAPLAYVAPVEGLLIVQAVAVGSAVVPAFRLGEHFGGHKTGLLAAAWFGLSASVWHTVLFDFRPATLGVVALMWLIAEMETSGRLPQVIGLAAMAASTREDIAILAGLAIVIFAVSRRGRALALVGAATAGVGVWFSTLGVRLFAPFDYFLWYRYADYGRTPGEVLANLDYAIPTALGRVVRDDPLVALAALVVPMLVVAPFLGWRYAWPGFLIVLSNAVSADPYIPTIYYQYYLSAVVFFIWGGVHGCRRQWWADRMPLAWAAAFAVFIVVGPLGVVMPGQDGRSLKSIVSYHDRQAMAEVLADVPRDASVSGGTYLLAHLSGNPEIKPFPAPFVCSPVLLTYYPQTSYPDYVVVETQDLEDFTLQMADLGYERLRSEHGVTVWRSTGVHPPSITCPPLEEAREGLFERIEGYAQT